MREHWPVHSTYKEKVDNQQGRSDTEHTKAVVGHWYPGTPAALVVGDARTTNLKDFVLARKEEELLVKANSPVVFPGPTLMWESTGSCTRKLRDSRNRAWHRTYQSCSCWAVCWRGQNQHLQKYRCALAGKEKELTKDKSPIVFPVPSVLWESTGPCTLVLLVFIQRVRLRLRHIRVTDSRDTVAILAFLLRWFLGDGRKGRDSQDW